MAKKITPEMRAAHARLVDHGEKLAARGLNNLPHLAVGDGEVCDGAASRLLLLELAEKVEDNRRLDAAEGRALSRLLRLLSEVSDDATKARAWTPTARTAFAGPEVVAIGRLGDWESSAASIELGAQIHLLRQGRPAKTTAKAWAAGRIKAYHRGVTQQSNKREWYLLTERYTQQARRALEDFYATCEESERDAKAQTIQNARSLAAQAM